jgi:ribonuclease D
MHPPRMEEESFEYVDTQEGLDALCDSLESQSEIALDSEADNLHHFDTKLCLLQMRFEDRTYLLDMLVDIDYSRFWETLKVLHLIMHGSDFDLRLFREFANFQASSIFDSMLASQHLGIKRFGLAALLEEYFQVKLPKDSQKSDWSQRPLTDKMLRYAANDVRYLHQLRDLLLKRMRELGRESWLHQRCEYQIETALSGFPVGDEHSWRIARSDKLDSRGKVALYELWHWREELAERLDRPPFKVLGNEYMIKLAEAVSEGNWQFVFESLPMGIQRRKRQGLVDALKRGTSRDADSLPARPSRNDFRKPLNQVELDRQEKIKQYRNEVAGELGIDPTLIATRSHVAALARDSEAREGLLDWQIELLEPVLQAVDSATA